MDNMSENIVAIYVENRGLTNKDLNLIQIGQDISEKMGYKLMILGMNLEEDAIDFIRNIDCKLLNIKHELLDKYNYKMYSKALSQAIEYITPKYLMFTTTLVGKELSSKISSMFDTGMISDAIKYLVTEGGELLIDKPSFGDQVYAKIGFNRACPGVITFRQIFNIEESEGKGKFIYEAFSPNINHDDFGLKAINTENVSAEEDEGENLQNAKIIVAAGLGIKKRENLELIYKLAELINGEVGVTKALVDKGWAKKDIQIGQTGVITNPDTYIAFGISGASQHTIGFSGAKKVIAINQNKDANIFNVADIGLAADAEQVLKHLISKLQSE